MRQPSKSLLQAIAVTAELTGTTLSSAAARVMADDLAQYPEPQVLGALIRCRRELRGRLTLADVIARIADGRPGPEEAWAMIPTDEAGSVVWTEEMAHAYGVAAPLAAQGDRIAARLAFKEAYAAAVQKSRDECAPVRWFASLGTDQSMRRRAIDDAVRLGRLPADHAQRLLPPPAETTSNLPSGPIREQLAKLLPSLGERVLR